MLIQYNNDFFQKIFLDLFLFNYENFRNSFNEKYNNSKKYAIFLNQNNELTQRYQPSNKINIKNEATQNIQIQTLFHSENNDKNEANGKNSQNIWKFQFFDNFNINNQIKNFNLNKNQRTNKGKLNERMELNKQLISIILILLDFEIIKKQMNYPLNRRNNDFQNYYLLNYEWFKKYLEEYNMNNIYNYLKDKRIIEKIFNNNIDKVLNKNIIIEKASTMIDSNLIKQIKKSEKIINFSNISYSYFNKIDDKLFVYFNNFIILTEETIYSLPNVIFDKIRYKDNIFSILFGDNRIFIKILNNNQNALEIGNLNENYIFVPYLFFDYLSKFILENNLKLMINNGYKQYNDSFLLFSNDYISPIFDINSEIEGYAYKFDISISDYRDYHISNQLKAFIKLYLNPFQLKYKLKKGRILSENYYIINQKFIKKYKDFYNDSALENELKKNIIISQIINTINNIDSNEQNLINEKKIILVIKYLSPGINFIFNKKKQKYINEEQEEPNLEVFYINSDINLFYYINFLIINKSIYNLISEKYKFSDINNVNENYSQCFFINNYILIDVSKNNNINKYVLEVCTLNSYNDIIPKYLLIYNRFEDFQRYLIFFGNELGLEHFLEGMQFNSTNFIDLFIENERKIGVLYDLTNINNNVNMKYNNQINNMQNSNMSINIVYNKKNNISSNNLKNENNFYNISLNSDKENIQNIIIDNYIESPEEIPKITSIKQEFPFPPKIGLQNVGATCYMNATLQCFCQIEKLVSYFKYNDRVIYIINNKYKWRLKDCLTDSFKYLVENLWPSNNKYQLPKYKNRNSNNEYFIPYKFKEKISNMNTLFQGAQANDSKDLVNFIIMTLHEELNEASKNKNININKLEIDQTNSIEILQNFKKCFDNENQSIISDIFYGVNYTITQCSVCQITKYNYQAYFFLIFPLEEVRKYKIEQLQNQMLMAQNMMNINPLLFQQNLQNIQNLQNSYSVNIYDCFNYSEKCELFMGENSMYCNKCKQQLPASYKTILYSTPEILIIVLNRGKGIEFPVKLEFQEDLNLMNYVQMKNTEFNFKLIGVVTHLGESGSSGHFIAYCKSPIGGEWFNYNDDIVTPVTNFKEQIIDYAMPYILFYQKADAMK